MKLVTLSDVGVAYDGYEALQHVNLEIDEHDFLGIIGPNADNVYNQLGDYTAQQSDGVTTLRRGIERLIGADRVRYVRGCAIRDLSSAEIDRAVDAARRSDVVVVAVGGSSARDFDPQPEGHGVRRG